MPLPAGLATATVSGRYVDNTPAGNPRSGILIFGMPQRLVYKPADPAERCIIIGGPTQVALNGAGEFALDVIRADAADLTPQGWPYSVDERVGGSVKMFPLVVTGDVDISQVAA